MKIMLKLTTTMACLTAVIVGLSSFTTATAATVFLSTSDTNPGTPANPTLNLHSFGAKTLWMWVTDDVNVTPAGTNTVANSNSAGFALNIARTAGTNVALSGVVVDNPTITGGTAPSPRWSAFNTLENPPSVLTASLIQDVEANVVTDGNGTKRGLSNGNEGFDPLYNAAADAFRFGKFTYNVSAYGSSTIALQASTLGIAVGGTNLNSQYTFGTAIVNVTHLPGDTNADGLVDLGDLNNVINFFGSPNPGGDGANDGPPVGLSDLNAVINNFGSGDGSFAAVPEPASLGLLCLGGVLLLGSKRVRGYNRTTSKA